jgi:acetyltransferase-like isoleucine patch superfamily enzyme
VVLRDVPPGEVWAGNPARPLRAVARKEPEPEAAPALATASGGRKG